MEKSSKTLDQRKITQRNGTRFGTVLYVWVFGVRCFFSALTHLPNYLLLSFPLEMLFVFLALEQERLI